MIVKEIKSRRVFITGRIEKPGPYPLNGNDDPQLIAMAGGLREFVDGKNISLMRSENDRQTVHAFNYQDVVKKGYIHQNIERNRRRRRRSLSESTGATRMAMRHAVRIMSVMALVLACARAGDAQPERTSRTRGCSGRARRADPAAAARSDLVALRRAGRHTFLSDETDILDATLQSNRMYSGAGVSLAYTRRPPHKVLTLTASSAARYYPDLHRLVSTRYGAAAVRGRPDGALDVADDRVVSYSPYYTVFLGAAPPVAGPHLVGPSADYAASRQDSMTYSSYFGAKRMFSETSR